MIATLRSADAPESRRSGSRRPPGSRSNLQSLRALVVMNPRVVAAELGLAFTVASWPLANLAPTTGLDQSWGFALAYSAVHHIAWGPRLDFAYGPLGFLTVRSLYFGSTAALAFVYQFAVHWALFTLLLRFVRTTLPLLVAVVISYAIGATAISLVDPGDLLMAPTLLLGILAVRQHRDVTRRILVAVLAAIAALGFFLKFADGLIPLAVLVVIIATGQRRERVPDSIVTASVFAPVLVMAWLTTGNGLGALPSYFRYSAEIAGGYSSAMQLEMGRTDEWWYAAIVLVAVAILTTLSLRQASRRERVATALVLVAYSWWALKEGFVRHDAHDLIFFGLMFVTLAIVNVPSPRFPLHYVTAVAFVAVIVWSAAGAVPSNLIALGADAHDFGDQINAIVNSHARNSTISAARTRMQQTYAVSSNMVAELSGHSVAIEPWENSVAWAYPAIRWDPEPVLQAYTAYTSSLDALDSRFIDSSNAPSRILQQAPAAVDERDPFFEPPRTFINVVCRYAQIDSSTRWQVLKRVPQRCGPPRLLARATATFGRLIAVPEGPPGTMVVARFDHLPLPISYKLSALLLKPPVMFLDTPGSRYRFVVGTAGDLHLLRPPSSLGYTAPFVPTSLKSLALSGGGFASGDGHYDVSFYSVRVAAT